MNSSEREKTPLEKMNERLYAPRTMSDAVRPSMSSESGGGIRHGGWQHETLPPKPPAKFAPSVIFLGAALVFFAVAAAIAAFLLITGGTSVSSDKVEISVNKEQPNAISSGDVVPLLIEIENNNAVAITNVSLTVRFPEGTYDPDQEGKTLTQQTIQLETIPANGEPVRRTVRARLFGMENQKLSLPLTLEYKTEGSNAVFVKQETYTPTISSSPIALDIQAVTEVSAGQEFTVVVTARSNATSAIPNVVVKPSYPFGFSKLGSDSIQEVNGLIPFGTLLPGEAKEVTLRGAVSGNEGDERVLRFSVGTSDTSSKFVSYIEKSASVFLTKPFLKIDLSLNRSTTEAISVTAGSEVTGTLAIGNTLSDPILDGAVLLSLKGSIIDTSTIQVTNGFYNSADQTIRFTKETIPGLATLRPGESVNGTFSFRIKNAGAIGNQTNPSALLTVSAGGNRTTAGNVSQTLSSTISRTIQIQSALAFDAALSHTEGPFENGGPLPPSANTETFYTVLLSVKNGVNGIAKGSATLVLPSYVRFTGSVSPADGSITYNESTRTVTWNAGDIAANAEARGAFQIALLPSTSQRGTSPIVANSIVFKGFDRFVQKDLTINDVNLDTRTTGDAGYTASFGQIQ